uniref:PC-esterase domain-containing protein 1A-like n=2 Tax=Hirondellea gigas TaxID=1518452 RepID=A0A6A7G076_9CRUS
MQYQGSCKMADIFMQPEALHLLRGKFILLMGDSNTRALYNDLIYLLHYNVVAPPIAFRAHTSQEGRTDCASFDRVLHRSAVTDATRHIHETREYCGRGGVRVQFSFITRVLGDQTVEQLTSIEQGLTALPHIVVINSCVWDACRWGPMQEKTYQLQMVQLFSWLRQLLPPEALVIWTTMLPLSDKCAKGGFLIKQLEFCQLNIQFVTLEANLFASELCKLFGFDLLDLHYHMRFQLARRCGDGIHWETHAMRHITCLLLTHIMLSYGEEGEQLPNAAPSSYLSDAILAAAQHATQQQVDIRLNVDVLENVKKTVAAHSEPYHGDHEIHQIAQPCNEQQERRKMRARRFNTPACSSSSSITQEKRSQSPAPRHTEPNKPADGDRNRPAADFNYNKHDAADLYRTDRYTEVGTDAEELNNDGVQMRAAPAPALYLQQIHASAPAKLNDYWVEQCKKYRNPSPIEMNTERFRNPNPTSVSCFSSDYLENFHDRSHISASSSHFKPIPGRLDINFSQLSSLAFGTGNSSSVGHPLSGGIQRSAADNASKWTLRSRARRNEAPRDFNNPGNHFNNPSNDLFSFSNAHPSAIPHFHNNLQHNRFSSAARPVLYQEQSHNNHYNNNYNYQQQF